VGDGQAHGKRIEAGKVVCKHCSYEARHHRHTTGEAMVPDICARLRDTVIVEDGPQPAFAAFVPNNNVQVRLFDGGPMIDLGADAPTMLSHGLEALGELAKKTPGYLFSPILARALDRIRKAKEERGD
jgi:hypothetical protein